MLIVREVLRGLTALALLGVAQVWAQVVVPPDLYPIISPLFGGNSYASAHPTDYDIARDPSEVPATALPNNAAVQFFAHEITTFVAPGNQTLDPPQWSGAKDVKMNYFAFSATLPTGTVPAKVPGPFIRVREGNNVIVSLTNPSTNTDTHSIDFHAVVGLKGGAAMLMSKPGQTTTLTITPTHPGLFIYHCAESGTPRGIAEHMNQGMFGLILVEPKDPSARWNKLIGSGVKEFYVMEQDIFLDSKGNYDEAKSLGTLTPDYTVYNGRVSALVDHPLVAQKGKDAVVYHGAATVHPPSFHTIGGIYNNVFLMGDILSPPLENRETVLIPAAGSAIMVHNGDDLVVNFTPPSALVPSQVNILVDHASPYFRKGALGFMLATPEAPKN
jgi:nitrite reductase (NO-forming)